MEVDRTGKPNSGQDTGSSPTWSSAQVYSLALVCLLLGCVVGFLLHGPASAQKAPVQTAQTTPPQQQANAMSVSQQRLREMADKQAEPVLKQLKEQPNDPKLLAEAASDYYAGHQFNTAIEYYEKSANLKPDANVLTQLSNAYYYSGSTDKALATLNRALQVDPTFANALFNLGMLKWQTQGDTAGAIAAWKKLLKTNPNHPNRAQVEEMIERVRQHETIAKKAAK